MTSDKAKSAPGIAPKTFSVPNYEALANNTARLMEELGHATAASLKPVEEGRAKAGMSEEMSDIVKTLGQVVESCGRSATARDGADDTHKGFLELWANNLKKMQGETVTPVAEPEPSDKRFRDPEWTDNPIFDFVKQAYLLTTRWADDLVQQADDIDPHTKHKAQFYVKQLSSALAPTNFVATNPELLRTTLEQNGENLVRGMKMMVEDIKAGQGTLKLRQTVPGDFQVGVNLATTPGKVVFRMILSNSFNIRRQQRRCSNGLC